MSLQLLSRFALGAALCISPLSGALSANLAKKPLDEQFRNADEVLIANLKSSYIDEKTGSRFIVLNVKLNLKGSHYDQIEFAPENGMPEFSVDCCEASTDYIFFLRRIIGNKFESLDGHYSVLKLSVTAMSDR
jgi:hypothetical protein